jgi:1-deoxy-D-xylulose-5-phosphate reductoisomerase
LRSVDTETLKKKVIILGSTGSIGRAALEVIGEQRDRFEVVGLACGANINLLNQQIERFRPTFACVQSEDLKESLSPSAQTRLAGKEGAKAMVWQEADIVLNAMPGSSGLDPSVEALKAGKTLALANKESLVMAGRLILRLAQQGTARLIPVDSEHSALFQLLQAVPEADVVDVVITASGGPFRDYTLEAMQGVRPEDALNHPTWKMGRKVTLDSATLMNKGLEVIEARWLFNMDPSRIRVLVHPESILHGLVVLRDSSFLAYLAWPDMKIPIAYALNGGERCPVPVAPVDLEKLRTLTFYSPDEARFPSLRLAYDALSIGDSATVVVNAANEIAVDAFVQGRIRFTDIPALVTHAIEDHQVLPVIDDIDAVWETDRWARNHTETLLRKKYA